MKQHSKTSTLVLRASSSEPIFFIKFFFVELTDASDSETGAVLLQGEGDDLRPVQCIQPEIVSKKDWTHYGGERGPCTRRDIVN